MWSRWVSIVGDADQNTQTQQRCCKPPAITLHHNGLRFGVKNLLSAAGINSGRRLYREVAMQEAITQKCVAVTVAGRPILSTNKLAHVVGLHGHGQIVKEHDGITPDKSMCRGCHEDFYNTQNAANGGCWMFDKAKVVDKVGHSSIHICGGPDGKMVRTLSCWHGVRH